MRALWAITRRELQAYFASPLAYVIYAAFFAISGFFFFVALGNFNLISLQAAQIPWLANQLNINQMVIQPHMQNFSFLLLFVIPFLTMRLFAEEKRTQTMELLLTSPISIGHMVIGKFLASLFLFLGLVVLSVIYPFIVTIVSTPDWGPIISGYVGVLLVGCLYISVGLFISALTKSQVIAGFLSFVVLLFFYILPFLSHSLPAPLDTVISYIGFSDRFEDFVKGLIDIPAVVYFLSFIFFALYLTHQAVESVRWR